MKEPQEHKSKKQTFLIGLSNFLQKYRTFFVVFLVVVIVGLVSFAVVREIISKQVDKATKIAENAQDLYKKWSTESDDTKKKELEKQCEDAIASILQKYPRQYASQRAYFIRGTMQFDSKQWDKAADTFKKLADSFPSSYLAPISLNNASVSYENNNKNDQAIKTLEIVLDKYKKNFPDIPHVIFSLGRLYEETKDYKNAKKMYNDLVDNFSNSNWTNLARNRIIQLTVDGHDM